MFNNKKEAERQNRIEEQKALLNSLVEKTEEASRLTVALNRETQKAAKALAKLQAAQRKPTH